MSPLKKRPCLLEVSDALPQSQLPSVDNVNTAFASITDQIVSTGTVPDVRTTILQLDEWQRRLYATLAMQEAQLEAHRAKRLKSQRKQSATEYERAQLQHQIMQIQQVAIPNLETLARQETGILETTTSTGGDESSLDVVSSFLGVDVADPSKKSLILAKLKEGYDKRASLEKDLQLQKQALSQTQLALKQKQDLLRNLPAQLAAIERASQLLGKFMTGNNGKSKSGSAAYVGSHMAGSERLTRLEKAQQLPAPLYTLFSLLQHYLDESATLALEKAQTTEQSVGDNGASEKLAMKVSIAQSAAGATVDSVVWQLPVADVAATSIPTASSKHKYVSIHFTYHSQPVPVVTIHTTGCAALLNQDILLDELFPGDVDLAATTTGKSYLWSNHLAGLYQIPRTGLVLDEAVASKPTWDGLHASTRVVIFEVQRRIRANATLKHILFSLQRLRVPVPPAASTSKQLANHDTTWKPTNCKLTHFSANDEDIPLTLTGTDETGATVSAGGATMFQVEVRNGTKALYATIQFHTARYPAVPPVWSFRRSKKDDANSPLYDGELAQLTQQVNIDSLVRSIVNEKEASDSSATGEDLLLYYEWILVHQLRGVLLFWDDSTGEHNSREGGHAPKGRDRKTA